MTLMSGVQALSISVTCARDLPRDPKFMPRASRLRTVGDPCYRETTQSFDQRRNDTASRLPHFTPLFGMTNTRKITNLLHPEWICPVPNSKSDHRTIYFGPRQLSLPAPADNALPKLENLMTNFDDTPWHSEILSPVWTSNN